MAIEIERKFLVDGDFKKEATTCIHIVQGYLSSDPRRTVRVRIYGDKAFLTIKGCSDKEGLARFEWERVIDIQDAGQLLALCEPGVIDKTRHLVSVGEHTYEVDEFHGENEGLLVAEIELVSQDEEFERPQWLGREVTGDKRYYNSMLKSHPYKQWGQKE